MSHRRPTRRDFIKVAATLPLAAALPALAFDRLPAARRKFLVLFAPGGWDPTFVFESRRRAGVDRPAGTRAAHNDHLSWASAPSRPSVDRFFRQWGDRSAIVNGIHTPCLGHRAATQLLFSGAAVPGRPEWPALLAGATKRAAPHRSVGASFADDLRRAARELGRGRTRCQMLQVPGSWDTHDDNTVQGAQFETLFDGLGQLFDHLSRSPGRHAATGLDELTVVVCSEFGRTPQLNAAGGKHHWPVTSALLAGAGIAGGRVIGATNGDLEALPVDFSTGRPLPSGKLIRSDHLGATLLVLGGVPAGAQVASLPVLGPLLA